MIRIAQPLPHDDGPYEYRGHFNADASCRMNKAAGTTQMLSPADEKPIGFAADPSNLYCYVGNSPE